MPVRNVLLPLLLVMVTQGVLAAQWPVKDFEIFFGDPWHTNYVSAVAAGRTIQDSGFYDLDGDSEQPANISDASKLQIEAYLGAVARHYEAIGFLPPVLEPIVERADGSSAFRIYLYDRDDTAPAVYSSDCSGGALRRTIQVDTDLPGNLDAMTIGSNGKVSNKGYKDLAHELFHAVQASYPLFQKNCALGDWIVEGTADALGVDMARKLRGLDLVSDADRWGMRRYHYPLRVRDDPGGQRKQDGYKSASFWRYIGEKSALFGGNPSLNFVEPDYSYLHDFFKANLSAKASEKTELDWLNVQLKKHSNILLGLDRLYPNFISTFAGYIHTRLITRRHPGNAGRDVWLGQLFGKCPVLTVDSGWPAAKLQLNLKKVTAGCFILNSDISDAVDIAVSARASSVADLRALAIGTDGGAKVGQPKIVYVNNEYIAHWLFRTADPSINEPVFVVSNIANDPSLTKEIKVEIEVSASAWSSNISTP